MISVVLFSVYVLQRRSPARDADCHSSGMLRQQYDTSAVVSARAHGFYSVPYSYEFFLQVDAFWTVSTRKNKECLTERIDNGTPAVLSARADLIFLETTHYDKQFFLQADSLQTFLRHQNGQSLAKP